MRKLERRAFICLSLAAVLFLGTGFFTFKFFINGESWATFYANDNIYDDGILSVGRILDRNGKVLANNNHKKIKYADDEILRRATVHVVGDRHGNISTSAETVFSAELSGYNKITGTYSLGNKGNDVKLTIDADASKAAYNALAGRNGLVGVYNYETGEILCAVSTPSFDPKNPPEISEDDTSGIYMNKFFSSSIVPGSIFKLVTTGVSLEKLMNLENFSYTCTGSKEIDGEKITCPFVHGEVDFYGALANSCNCAYASLILEVGSQAMYDYTKKFNLVDSMNIDGIETATGSFNFPESRLNLGWAGIGQYEDLINPCTMLTYVGAIANGGESAYPVMIDKLLPNRKKTEEFLSEESANSLQQMMKNNVEKTYGTSNFPGLDIFAKSGTAEVGNGNAPHGWFTGFIKNEDHPYAFIVCVENGGYGSSVAGPVANKVLQELVN